MTIVPAKPLLSRVADSVYWMSRYIERAENVARFMDVNLHLALDSTANAVTSYTSQWQPIVDTSGDRAVFLERYGSAMRENVIRFLAFDDHNPNSICACVRAARENARSVRETISSEMWEQVNSLYLLLTGAAGNVSPDELPAFFRSVRMGCHLFEGITAATMSHNEAWHFCRLARCLERADKTTRILDVKYYVLLPSISDVGTPYDDIQWAAVLKSVSGFEMYRKRHGRILPDTIVDFLLLDAEFPRAVRHSIGHADQSLHAITGTPAGGFGCPSEQRLGQLRSELDFADVNSILLDGLHEFLDGLQTKMNTIDECVQGDFFVHAPAMSAAG